MEKIPQIAALEELIQLRRQQTVSFGRAAFAEEHTEEIRREAERLDQLLAAQTALEQVEAALLAFPPLPESVTQSPAPSSEDESKVEPNRRAGYVIDGKTVRRSTVITDEMAGKQVFLTGRGANGRGTWTGDSLIVLEGRIGRTIIHASMNSPARILRGQLATNGAIRVEGETFLVLADLQFKTSSAAAQFLLGRSANGRTEWKLESGETLGVLITKDD